VVSVEHLAFPAKQRSRSAVLTRNALEMYSRETQCFRLPDLDISYVLKIATHAAILRNAQLSLRVAKCIGI